VTGFKEKHQRRKGAGERAGSISDLLGATPEDMQAFAGQAKAAGLFLSLDPAQCSPDPDQPRKIIEQEALDELTASIEANGQIQPIVVRPVEGDASRYIVVVGERRWRAISQSKLVDRIDAIVRPQADDVVRRLLVQIEENQQREPTTVVETAEAVARVVELSAGLGKGKGEAADMLRMSAGQLSKFLALANAPENIKALSWEGKTQDLEALYELARSHEENPEAVGALVETWEDGGLKKSLRVAAREARKPKDKTKKKQVASIQGGPLPSEDGHTELEIVAGLQCIGDVIEMKFRDGRVVSGRLPAELAQAIREALEVKGASE